MISMTLEEHNPQNKSSTYSSLQVLLILLRWLPALFIVGNIIRSGYTFGISYGTTNLTENNQCAGSTGDVTQSHVFGSIYGE